MFIGQKMDEKIVVYSFIRIVYSNKMNNENEQTIVTCNNTDKSHKSSQTQKNTYSMTN